ncbi:MAG: class I SAM-dependent methyltransferase [Candidatus Aminicenantes bacterium]|nr:class I SAM-dependent methyltransferase [Candidatus Aminicenantes bacterium]
MFRFFLEGFLYDVSIGLALKKTRRKIADIIFRKKLYPVIDVCCGTGQQCGFLEPNGFISGIDNDEGFLGYARSRYPDVSFVCGDAGRLPFRDESFLCAVISYSLHEKPMILQNKMMDEVRRICRPDAFLIILDYDMPWNRKSKWGKRLTYLIERSAGGDHFRYHQSFLNRGGLQAFIKEHKLKEVGRIPLELGCSSVEVLHF